MNTLSDHINELQAEEAFTRQSKVFDNLYNTDGIIQYKRQRVREHILRFAKASDSMLELNCGTGEDALFFSGKGFHVHATDISTGMLEIFQNKIDTCGSGNISIEQCSFTELSSLKNTGPFNYIYSNLGGLNCTSALGKVLNSLKGITASGGVVTLVIISKFCLWETLLLFKGKFKTAFRRFFNKKGTSAHVEGKYFKCRYYSPSFIEKHMQKDFEWLQTEGLCTIVPPSYIEHFAEKHPQLFSFLKQKENKLKSRWPWKTIGDYFIISFKRKTV